MQTLFILGNGFDINLKMKTSYNDFYADYKVSETSCDVINALKLNITENINTWADLEIRLGEYLGKVEKFEDYQKILNDLIENLGNYLEKTENDFDFENTDEEALLSYLAYPQNFLSFGDKFILNEESLRWKDYNWEVNVMSFNYTTTLEKLLNDNYRDRIIGHHHSKLPILLKEIYHIHGLTDDGMVLGVNDVTQLLNGTFHNDNKVVNSFIKSNYIRSKRTFIDQICKKHIDSANLIYIFGCSLGDSDNCWWESIGERLLKSNCLLIIFTHSSEMRKRHYYNLIWNEDFVKDKFINKANLSDEQSKIIRSKIFVTASSNLFSQLVLK